MANTDVTTLKSAGLSTRKAEYGAGWKMTRGFFLNSFVISVVLDLASRFADGRLSNQKLIEADDEELARLLIEVRGIGRVRFWYDLLLVVGFDWLGHICQWTGEYLETQGSLCSSNNSGYVRHIFLEKARYSSRWCVPI